MNGLIGNIKSAISRKEMTLLDVKFCDINLTVRVSSNGGTGAFASIHTNEIMIST